MAIGIFIPAEQSFDCTRVQVATHADIERILGGEIEPRVFEPSAVVWTSAHGDVSQTRWNVRAMDYAEEHQPQSKDAVDFDPRVFGNAFLLGDNFSDAPEHLFDCFGAYHDVELDEVVRESQHWRY